jgi:hypothetical protein
MKIFLSKTNLKSLEIFKKSLLNLKTYKINSQISAKYTTSSTKYNKNKVKNVKEKENNQLYTTSSYLSEQNVDIVKNLKTDLSQETENKKTLQSKKFLAIIPLVFAPFCFHFPLDLFESLYYSNFFHYSFQIAVKHIFLINTFNMGITLGYTMSLADSEKNVDYQKILLRVGLTFASFFMCNVLVSCPMNPYLFNGLYLTLMGSSVYIANAITSLHPLYAKYAQIIIFVGMTVMLLLINYYYQEWKLKISEEGKFEETVKFYELSKDKEFAKIIDRIEKNLREIDIKIAKRKD